MPNSKRIVRIGSKSKPLKLVKDIKKSPNPVTLPVTLLIRYGLWSGFWMTMTKAKLTSNDQLLLPRRIVLNVPQRISKLKGINRVRPTHST